MIRGDVSHIRQVIQENESFTIAGHVNPDGDCIGASLALGLALAAMGKKPRVFLESFGVRFSVIPGSEYICSDEPKDAASDVFFCLDCGAKNRLGFAAPLVDAARQTIIIDHHIGIEDFGHLCYWDETASSTCELVYQVLRGFAPIDSNIATALYAGIVYDTGGFAQQNTAQRTMNMAGELMNLGARFTEVYGAILRSRTEHSARMLAVAIGNFKVQQSVGASFVTLEDLKKAGAAMSDLDEIVSYLAGIDGTTSTIFAYEKEPGRTKVSMRSKVTDVCAIAKGFGGGGHVPAAGCDVDMPPEKACRTFADILVNNGK